MIGIYKITDLTNGKIYIGQSNNIQRRKSEHFYNNKYIRSEIDKAIQDKGKENFTFEVIEECLAEELYDKEKYWITFYDSFNHGYNQTKGGQHEYCGRRKLTVDDIVDIRTAYNNHEEWFSVYEKYKDIITVDGFKHIWQGNRWKSIMPEVYNEENKTYYKKKGRFQAGNGNLSDEEVIELRKRYVNETAEQIWQDYKDLYTLGSFKQLLQGVKYNHLPIYKKQQRKWINTEGYNEFN